MDSTYPLTIGADWDPAYVFNGRVDEVALYKRVLSANERGWLYNGGLGRTYSELTSPPTVTNPTNYTYGAFAHRHAVTYLSNGNTYQYDANGNQITRIIGADTFLLSYDAENRLVEVKKNNVVVASFTFDADGKRVKSVMGSDTILFVGAHYEIKNGSEITKYYLAGTTRVAMRKYTIPQNMSVEYLLSDQLGSTSLTTDTNGAKVLELRYKAWGETRATWTSSPSTTPAYKMPLYTFTGQASYMDDPTTTGTTEGFGLMFYRAASRRDNARWYDPYLNHFTQPDSIVPDPSNSQDWDRYAYTANNPLRYTDPTGHVNQGQCNYLKNYNCEYHDPQKGIGSSTGATLLTYALAGIATESPLGINTRPRGFVTNWLVTFIHKLVTGDTEIGIGLGKIYDSEMGSGNSRYPGLGLNGVDQDTPAGALLGMEKRISLRLDKCVGCSETDLLIVAALAVDDHISLNEVHVATTSQKYAINSGPVTVDWGNYLLKNAGNAYSKDMELIQLFSSNVLSLRSQGYYVPNVDFDYIQSLFMLP